MGSRGQSVFSVLFLNLKVMFRSILPSPFVLHWFIREKIYCHWKGINDTRNFHSLELYGTKNIWEGCRFLRAIKSSLFIPWWWLLVVCSLLLIFWLFGPTPQFVSISPPSLATLRFCHASNVVLGNLTWNFASSPFFGAANRLQEATLPSWAAAIYFAARVAGDLRGQVTAGPERGQMIRVGRGEGCKVGPCSPAPAPALHRPLYLGLCKKYRLFH